MKKLNFYTLFTVLAVLASCGGSSDSEPACSNASLNGVNLDAAVFVSSHYEGDGSTQGSTLNHTATAAVSGDQLTLTGLLSDWDNQTLTLVATLVEGSETGIGTVTYGDQAEVVFPDDWTYKLRPTEGGTNTYNACTGNISLEYELWYYDPNYDTDQNDPESGWYWWTTFETDFSKAE